MHGPTSRDGHADVEAGNVMTWAADSVAPATGWLVAQHVRLDRWHVPGLAR